MMFTAYKRPRLQRGSTKPITSGGWKASNAAAKIWSNYKPKTGSKSAVAKRTQ